MRKCEQAFTLFEMLVVVAIIAVMLLIAYPNIQEMMYGMESRRVERTFQAVLRQARAESFITKKDVLICSLNDAGVCDRAGEGQLWLFFDDNDNNQKDGHEKAIYEQPWRLRYGQILLRTSAQRPYIRYMGDSSKPRGHIGHLRYCSVSKNPRLSFKVVVNMHGRIRVERGDLVDVGCG